MKTKITLTLIAAAAFVAALLTSCGLPIGGSATYIDPKTGTETTVTVRGSK
jgi:hypothetical protein